MAEQLGEAAVIEDVVDRGDTLVVDTTVADAAATAAAAETIKQAAIEKDIIGDKGKVADTGVEDKKDEAVGDKKDDARDETGKFVAKAIPKARVDEMVNKEKLRADAAERQLAEIQKQNIKADNSVAIAALEQKNKDLDKEHAQATLDGKADRMAEIAAEIRANERAINANSVQNISTQTLEQMREELRIDVAIENAQKLYPSLVQGNEAYDQDVVDMILNAQEMYMKRDSMPAAQALTMAAEKIMGKLIVTASDSKDAEAEDEAKGLDAAKSDDTKSIDRKAAAVAKNLDTASKQPANMKETGIDSDKAGITSDVDANKLSTEEFDALPEATKARMRGDTL